MIPADLGAELAAAIRDLVAAGRLPPSATGLTAAGTWRPAPERPAPGRSSPVRSGAGPGPGAAGPGPNRFGTGAAGNAAARYATSLPFELARLAGEEPGAIAAELGRAILRADWVTSAEPTGAGYLTIGVTGAALAAVAVRISQAGPCCVRSTDLRSVSRPAPPLPDLAVALSWRQAWRDQAAALTGRLARAAGATPLPPAGSSAVGDAAGGGAPGGGVAAEAVAYAGADAVRYWLARMPAARAHGLDRMVAAGRDPARRHETPYSAPPFVMRDLSAVSFAAADAAAQARWAAELGLARREPLAAGDLGKPAEAALLTELSWLAERVAGAARRGQPDELPRYLERLAGAWLDCRESCPALPFGGRAAPGGAAGVSARLWLAGATATALAAGLDLVGIRGCRDQRLMSGSGA